MRNSDKELTYEEYKEARTKSDRVRTVNYDDMIVVDDCLNFVIGV